MIDIEKIVSDLVDTYNRSSFINDNQSERDLFLCYLVICFVNHLENGYYTKTLKNLSSSGAFNKGGQVQTLSKNLKFKRKSHEEIFREFLDGVFVLNNAEKIEEMFGAFASFLEISPLRNTGATDLVIIYDHLLQRLQMMNADDRLKADFKYQEPPFDFSRLISLLADRKGAHTAYDPFATTGESSVSYALNSKNVSITTESVLQSSTYIRHKLVIAGVSNIDSKHSYALSPKSNVEPESFDVAYTLFQPTETSGVGAYEQKQKIKNIYEDKRIDSDTIFDKYREHGFIQQIIWSLKNNGIGFVVIGKGPLHRQLESKARNLLLEGNLVDAVIQLPSKLITSRTVPLYVVVLRKNRGNDRNIKFIDASSFCEFDGRRNNLVNLEKLADVYKSPNEADDFVSLVNIDDIDKNSALLTVSSYVSSLDESYEEIDVDAVRSALAKQQRITGKLLEKLNNFS